MDGISGIMETDVGGSTSLGLQEQGSATLPQIPTPPLHRSPFPPPLPLPHRKQLFSEGSTTPPCSARQECIVSSQNVDMPKIGPGRGGLTYLPRSFVAMTKFTLCLCVYLEGGSLERSLRACREEFGAGDDGPDGGAEIGLSIRPIRLMIGYLSKSVL